mgnify:CR=1 FL=1
MSEQLIEAIRAGDTAQVNTLLEQGADANARARLG